MPTPENHVFAVHAVRSTQITAIKAVFTRRAAAEKHAKEVSNDPGVEAGAVTELLVNEPGHTTAVALYVDGVRQALPHISDNRRVRANGLPTTGAQP